VAWGVLVLSVALRPATMGGLLAEPRRSALLRKSLEMES